MVFKRRHLLSAGEMTLSYNMVAQVILKKFPIVFAHLDIVTTGSDTEVQVRWVSKKKAIKAKEIIDKKVHQTYFRNSLDADAAPITGTANMLKNEMHEVEALEKSIIRLDELYQQGRLTKGEYKKKRKQLLKNH